MHMKEPDRQTAGCTDRYHGNDYRGGAEFDDSASQWITSGAAAILEDRPQKRAGNPQTNQGSCSCGMPNSVVQVINLANTGLFDITAVVTFFNS
jgi:hypothetical protein